MTNVHGESSASTNEERDGLHGRSVLPVGEDDEEGLQQRAAAAAARAKEIRETKASLPRARRQPVRAIGEDDDGYDPYSDFHDFREAGPLFERDPWD